MKEYFNSEKGQLAVLIKMAKADGKVVGSEKMFLNLMARKLRISATDFEKIYENPDQYNYNPPVEDEECYVLFYRVIQMMKMDLSVDVDEIEFCKEIGSLLNIPNNKIDEIIKLSILKNKEVVSYDAIRELLVK